MNILVTGGAGFVGSHLVDKLIIQGYSVRILDNLDPQVHANEKKIPYYINSKADFLKGNILNPNTVRKALKGIDIVVHLAASVGVSQSMYQILRYTKNNTLGGAVLLQQIISEKTRIKKVVVASSMSIYGEGQYKCIDCGIVAPKIRTNEQFHLKRWEVNCPLCGKILVPTATSEDKPLYPTSIYAITKRDHEEMFLNVSLAYQIPCVALRFFNIYGPRQSLSNPYTGVMAILSSRILNGHPPVIFEDGLQSRDFVHIDDVVYAILLAIEKSEANFQALNVGTGKSMTILGVAKLLLLKLGSSIPISITNQFRSGDIRHCYADISQIRTLLGYQPRVSFEDGITSLTNWIREQESIDYFDKAYSELKDRNLTI